MFKTTRRIVVDLLTLVVGDQESAQWSGFELKLSKLKKEKEKK